MSFPTVPLGEVCTINPRAMRSSYCDDMLVSFVPMASVDERLGAITICEDRPVTEVSKGYTPFEDGDILFAKIGSCMENGKTALARNLTNGIGRGSTEFHVLRPGNHVLGEYVHHFVRQAWFRDEAKRSFTGTAQQRVPKSFMENIMMPLPPLDEQRRIVGVLDRAAKIERLRAEAQERLREFIPALFIKMFGDPVENSMGWKVRALGEVCAINPRANRGAYPVDMAVTFVPMAAVDEHLGAISTHESRPLSEVSTGYTSFQNNDIIFAKITPCMENGKAALAQNLVNGIGRGSTEFYVLRPGEQILSEYLYHFIRREQFRKEAKRSFTGTAGQQRVPKSFMEKISIPIPPLEVQRQFVTIIKTAETIATLGKESSIDATALLSSLMSRLLENDA